jgi:hypothetical protein
MTKKRILGCLRVPPVEYHWSSQQMFRFLWKLLYCVDVSPPRIPIRYISCNIKQQCMLCCNFCLGK